MSFIKGLVDTALFLSGPVGWYIGSELDQDRAEHADKARREGQEQGFKHGLKKGEAEANKKFADMHR